MAGIRGLVLALGCACLGLAASCGRGALGPAALERAQPGLRAIGARALDGWQPYGYPGPGGLWLFSCRWSARDAIPVALPPDRSEAEERWLRLALESWQAALPGLAFRVQERFDGAGIELRFDADAASRRSGEAAVDCALDPASLRAGAPRVAAELVAARVRLRRAELDALGRLRPHSPAEQLGSALHELGHALGFQGHARREGAVRREVEEARHLGRRVLAGERLRDRALEALYALPSGSVVARIAADAAALAQIGAVARAAARAGLGHPRLQVGDREARIAWLDAAQRAHALRLPDWPEVLAQRAALRVELLPRAAALLGDPGAGPRPGAPR